MKIEAKKILVTGAAGFIGMHVAKKLLDAGHAVIGIDNINDYYDVNLKYDRLAQLEKYPQFSFSKLNIADSNLVNNLFLSENIHQVVHLAAQAGVRYSLINPNAYVESNLVGFVNILETCRHHEIKHLVYASSSSVYGANTKIPFSESDNVDHPVSLYAATKKSDELMAYTYSHLFGLPTTGLRFFTVYGPWGRPDMSPMLFARAILEGRPIKVFNYGDMQRDFTYIDDIVEGVVRVLDCLPTSSSAPYRIFNIGNNTPVHLLNFIETLEECLGKKAEKELLPMQPGDVPVTYADVTALKEAVDFNPSTPLAVGLEKFAEWFCSYYKLS